MDKRTLVGVLALVWVIAGSAGARAEDDPPSQADAVTPPSIVYGSSRSSRTWLGKPGASRVAVDEGVSWKGVTVYLSLTWDLVGVDAKTDEVLYVRPVGAFWNALGFKQVTPAGGARTWAVELAPGPRARRGAERRQYHDLRTGEPLQVPGAVVAPSGKAFVLRASWAGDASRIAAPFTLIASSEGTWAQVQERMFGAVDPQRFGPVDFEREVVLIASLGNAWNTKGLVARGAYEDDQRILLRTDRDSFQTIGGGMRARPFGVFVLPRRAHKAYVVERDVQNLIGGPSIWKEVFRLARLGPAAGELAALPEASAAEHHGWEGQDEEPPRPAPGPPPPPPPRRPR